MLSLWQALIRQSLKEGLPARKMWIKRFSIIILRDSVTIMLWTLKTLLISLYTF